MELGVIIAVVLLGYVGAILALLYAKENYKDALVPGTIAWIIVLVVSFFIAFEAMIAVGGSFVLGILVQLVIARK